MATKLLTPQGGTGAATLTGIVIGDGANALTALALGAGKSIRRNAGDTAYEEFTAGGGGDVSKVGTPVNDQVGVWTGDGTIEGDAALTFDTTTNTLTSDVFAGNLTGNVTGNVSGSSATVTGAAQAAITSLGTLTALTVDDITINGNTVSSAGASSLAITPTAGQAILLDGTISVDAGVVTGATSVTSTTFVGALTGTASGNLVSGGALGTPSSGTLTNTTGLPLTGLVNDTTTALGVGSLELGHATDTTLTRVSAGVAAIEGSTIVVGSSSPTLGTITTTGSIELGHATDTTIARVSAGVASIEGATIVVGASSPTLGTITTTGSIELGHASDTTIARSGAGAVTIEGAAILLNGGALGTPSSGTLTNATGLPVAGITSSTSTALGVGSLEIGHASDTTLARVSSGVASIEGVNILTVAGGTLTGNITLGENTSIALDPAGSADGKYSGITVAGTAGAALAFGDVVVLDVTDSRWELADANSAAAADGDARGLLGICVLAAAGDGSATTILLNGIIRADTAFPALTISAPVYLSETAGDIVVAQPTTTDVVIRVLGSALTADEIYFNPSPDYITHT
jgi:hypothetical protein